MNLIDLPNVSSNIHLDEPLIPVPIEFPHEDCYIPTSSSTRWRSFINAEDWDPKKHNDDLLKKRDYHARIVWETSLLITMTDINWLCVDAIKVIQNVAHLELRISEIDLVSYQLTCGMIGVGAKERVKLYHCAVKLFMLNIFMMKTIVGSFGGEKESVDKKMAGKKPEPSDSKRTLCKQIDLEVFEVKELLSRGIIQLMSQGDHSFVAELGDMLKEVVISLDQVLVVQ